MTKDEMYTLMDVMGMAFYYPRYFKEVWIIDASNLNEVGERIDPKGRVFIPTDVTLDKTYVLEQFIESNGSNWN